ncbi:MAG: YIP1 family protein [Anaerolineales bacterium]|nr:YIP1 family protein [Anaerolineales bacterium]
MLQHIIGVFKLNPQTFETIEKDTNLTGSAALIVVVVSLLSGLGTGFYNTAFGSKTFFSGFLGGIISVLLGWLLWSGVTWFVGTRLFKGQADLGEMLRVIGFAYSPQILSIIPCVGGIIGAIWTLAAGFVAVRQGLDLDNTKTALTIVVGFVAYLVLVAIVNAVLF